jgi:hypothetical protein
MPKSPGAKPDRLSPRASTVQQGRAGDALKRLGAESYLRRRQFASPFFKSHLPWIVSSLLIGASFDVHARLQDGATINLTDLRFVRDAERFAELDLRHGHRAINADER